MRRIKMLIAAALCALLCGCSSWMDGTYYSSTPHLDQSRAEDSSSISAANEQELQGALAGLVSSGTENAVISIPDFPAESVESSMARSIAYITQTHPIGAYAVDTVEYEVGTSAGIPAIAVSISYVHGRSEIRQIKQVADMTLAAQEIYKALTQFDTGLVMEVRGYRDTDLAQIVENYAAENPGTVIEIPQVTATVYPESGSDRVLELIFTYQTSRDSLRTMQSQIKPIFDAAVLYVAGDAEDQVKYSQLYAFLMERFDYQIGTSITPAYSLLRHGVGDSKAFAQVYSAMCRRAGLECLVVSGARDGDALYWNIVRDNGNYYHVDLLRCARNGAYSELLDDEMSGYVWDYSTYPACDVLPEVPEEPVTEYPEYPESTYVPEEPTESDPTVPDVTKPSVPAETEPVPPETEPVQTDPAETEPPAAEAVQTEPAETEPDETEPTETETTETESTETEPVPTEAPSEPAADSE